MFIETKKKMRNLNYYNTNVILIILKNVNDGRIVRNFSIRH